MIPISKFVTSLLPGLLLFGPVLQAAADEIVPEIVKAAANAGKVEMVCVGDILLGDEAIVALQVNGYDWPFEHVKSLLEGADLVIGNLEGPITTAKERFAGRKDYYYKASPESAPALKRAGFQALSLANNHTLDYGVAGMRETIESLRKGPLGPFGAGEREAEARRGIAYDFGSIRIGLLAYLEEMPELKELNWFASDANAGCARLTAENLKIDIARLRPYADVIVVNAHWGRNYRGLTDFQKEMGHKAIELGADIVCGHHPHIAHGIEIYGGKPILYSLGNFVFGTQGRYSRAGVPGYGLVVRFQFEDKKLKSLSVTPIATNNKLVHFQPRRVPAEEARRALDPELQQFGTKVRWEGDRATIDF